MGRTHARGGLRGLTYGGRSPLRGVAACEEEEIGMRAIGLAVAFAFLSVAIAQAKDK